MDGSDDYSPFESWYGAYVDDLRIHTLCGATPCEPTTDCGDDGDPCTSDACTPFVASWGGACGRETSTPGLPCPLCDVEPPPPVEGFEDGLPTSWELEDPLPQAGLTWYLTAGGDEAWDGDAALAFGDPDTGTYASDLGLPAVGTVWPPLLLAGQGPGLLPALRFQLMLSTEYDGAAGPIDPLEQLDRLDLLVEPAEPLEVEVAWSAHDWPVFGSTKGEWVEVYVSLAPWAGQTLRVGFRFDRGDAIANAYGGPRLDALELIDTCVIAD